MLQIHLKQKNSLCSEKKKIVNKREQYCIVFQHPDFADEELYIVARYCIFLSEGRCIEFFRKSKELIEGVEDNVPVED